MDMQLLQNVKIDKLWENYEKLKKENIILREEIQSIKKIISSNYKNDDIINEGVFVSHKKNIEHLNAKYEKNVNFIDYYKEKLNINKEGLLDCFKDFTEGVSKIAKRLLSMEDVPLKCLNFKRNSYTYYVNNNEWTKLENSIIKGMINYIIKTVLFKEFANWQKENSSLIKNNPLDYHNNLQLIMSTPNNTMYAIHKNIVAFIK
mgnify:CR=1 FL=1